MFVKFVKDDKTIEEVSISSEMIPFPTDLSCEDFFKMKQFVQTGSKLQACKRIC